MQRLNFVARNKTTGQTHTFIAKTEREAREWYGSTTPDGDLLDDVDWEEIREMMDDDNSEILDEFAAELLDTDSN